MRKNYNKNLAGSVFLHFFLYIITITEMSLVWTKTPPSDQGVYLIIRRFQNQEIMVKITSISHER